MRPGPTPCGRGWRRMLRGSTGCLRSFGLAVTGGTSLFRHITTPQAQSLFEALGRKGILLRNFVGRPTVLRAGLPGSPEEWQRLEAGLAEWATAQAASRVGASQ